MSQSSLHPIGKVGSAHGAGPRRLIAGLRITPRDAELLAVVRPFFPDADSEAELAYRLWRRGLELALAEAVSIGARLPPDTNEQLIAGLVAQRLLLSLPLLRRTGALALLGIVAIQATDLPSAAQPTPGSAVSEAIDASAAGAIAGLGGNDFL